MVGLVEQFVCGVWWLGFSICYVRCMWSAVLEGMCDFSWMCLVYWACCVFSVI